MLRHIHAHTQQFKQSPTIREIQQGTNISSTSMVQYYVDELVCDGFVCRLPGIKRGLDLTTAGRMLMMVLLEMWAAEDHKEEEAGRKGKRGRGLSYSLKSAQN